jgi:hypothetical protein
MISLISKGYGTTRTKHLYARMHIAKREIDEKNRLTREIIKDSLSKALVG